jgi:hypothetical protein
MVRPEAATPLNVFGGGPFSKYTPISAEVHPLRHSRCAVIRPLQSKATPLIRIQSRKKQNFSVNGPALIQRLTSSTLPIQEPTQAVVLFPK